MRRSLPPAVILKRLAAPRCVLIFNLGLLLFLGTLGNLSADHLAASFAAAADSAREESKPERGFAQPLSELCLGGGGAPRLAARSTMRILASMRGPSSTEA